MVFTRFGISLELRSKNILKYVLAFGNARGTAPAKVGRDYNGLRAAADPLGGVGGGG